MLTESQSTNAPPINNSSPPNPAIRFSKNPINFITSLQQSKSTTDDVTLLAQIDRQLEQLNQEQELFFEQFGHVEERSQDWEHSSPLPTPSQRNVASRKNDSPPKSREHPEHDTNPTTDDDLVSIRT